MLVVLGIMVLVHETGHFVAAKLCGVRVEIFSIGFGQRLLGFKRGDTDYRLSLLPLGGYVKMAGEYGQDPIEFDSGDFNSKPRWQRIIIGLAGPVSNFILAFALMAGMYMMHNEVDEYLTGAAHIDYVTQSSPAAAAGLRAGDTVTQFGTAHNPTWQQIQIRIGIDGASSTVPVAVSRVHNGQASEFKTQLPLAKGIDADGPNLEALGMEPRYQAGPIVVHSVEADYPLVKAGAKPGDVIQAINGVELHSVPSISAYLQQNGKDAVALTVLRNGQQLKLNVAPVWGNDGVGHMGYRLGFNAEPPPFVVQKLPFGQAAVHSYKWNVQYSGYIFEVFQRLFSRHSNVRQVSGPVGIARATGEAVTMPGWQPIISLMAMISLNLGIFNLLPFPLLDGGMIFLLLIESAMRHDLNPRVKERVWQAAGAVLVLFFVFVTLNDILRLPIFVKLHP